MNFFSLSLLGSQLMKVKLMSPFHWLPEAHWVDHEHKRNTLCEAFGRRGCCWCLGWRMEGLCGLNQWWKQQFSRGAGCLDAWPGEPPAIAQGNWRESVQIFLVSHSWCPSEWFQLDCYYKGESTPGFSANSFASDLWLCLLVLCQFAQAGVIWKRTSVEKNATIRTSCWAFS